MNKQALNLLLICSTSAFAMQGGGRVACNAQRAISALAIKAAQVPRAAVPTPTYHRALQPSLPAALFSNDSAEKREYDISLSLKLRKAAEAGKTSCVKVLSQLDADLNRVDGGGGSDHYAYTPLMLAVLNGDAPTAEELIKAGANVNIRSENYQTVTWTALTCAAKKGNVAIIEALIKAGANVDTEVYFGTPLTFAVASEHPDAVQKLLDAGAQVNGLESQPLTPLMVAAKIGNPSIVRILAHAKGIDINAENDNGRTALHIAALNDKAAAAKALILADADINAVDNNGETALHLAATNDQATAAKVLILADADITAVDNNGRTALHVAASNGCFSAAKALIHAGADITAVDNNRRTASQLAAIGCHEEITDMLLKAATKTEE